MTTPQSSSDPRPFQPPTETPTKDHVLIAKSFSYDGAEPCKGVIFTGAIIAGSDGLFLSHDKHAWQSAGTAAAAFGLLGMAIHALVTRNKTFDYPYPVLPHDEMPPTIRDRMMDHKFKPSSMVSIIQRQDIVSYSTSMLSKKFTLTDGVVLNLVAAVKKGMKRLPDLGYEQA